MKTVAIQLAAVLRVAVRGLGAVVVKLRTCPLVSSRVHVVVCPRGIAVHLVRATRRFNKDEVMSTSV